MSWKDNLVPASFRGVSFKIDSSSAEFGRRTVEHEYPLRDTPYSEDLGRKKQQFTIEAFVIGDDYISQRDRLISVCENQSGRGRLEHPYYGTKFVVCTACRVSESTAEGRMARISLTFVEAGERKFPAASTDFFSRLGIAGGSLISSALGGFANAFNVLGFPSFVLESASNVVNQLGDALNVVKGIAEGAAGFSQNIQNLLDDFSDLARTPALLGSAIVDVVKGIGDIGFDSDGVVNAYKSLFGFGDDEEDSIFTPSAGQISTSRIQVNKNREAILNLVKQTAIAQASVAAVEKSREASKPGQIVTRDFTPLDPLQVSAQKTYPTYESILVERREILDAIDLQIEKTLDDQVYQSLQSQKRALVQAFPDPDLDLPNLATINSEQTRPSLVIAYDLYEQLEMETDIIKRNEIEYPGFVPGGVSLEVISDG